MYIIWLSDNYYRCWFQHFISNYDHQFVTLWIIPKKLNYHSLAVTESILTLASVSRNTMQKQKCMVQNKQKKFQNTNLCSLEGFNGFLRNTGRDQSYVNQIQDDWQMTNSVAHSKAPDHHSWPWRCSFNVTTENWNIFGMLTADF